MHILALGRAAQKLSQLGLKNGMTNQRATGETDTSTGMRTSPAPVDPIFPRLLKDDGGLETKLIGFIAYGLYEEAKREWILEFNSKEGRYPSQLELQGYENTWTASRIESLRNSAVQAVTAYADTITTQAEIDILHRSLRGMLWPSIWRWLVSAAIFSVVVIGSYILCRRLGFDPLNFIAQLATAHPSS